ncbi:helix-turn-helix domain-containing protein [Rhodanobacter hydrolyticus]|uniref:Helix-turn-helix domain-containing protein n=1 Tax=Rhodanobacter hydrolyticus TaxID=2250595 RepID=A0ABW8J0Q8_9GAMM
MNNMQPSQSGQDPAAPDLFAQQDGNTEASFAMVVQADPDVAFGNRLRAAREARGLELGACAHALRLPLRILRKLEHGEHDGIDSRVYLASYIGKYSQYLGIDDTAIQAELARAHHVEPALVATGGISHSRFLFDRYATAATYVVLTLVIAVPTVWFGVRSTLDRDLSHLTPLDASPVAQQDTQQVAAPAKSTAPTLVAKAPDAQPSDDQPLMASMAPFPSMDNGSLASPKASVPAPAESAGATAATVGTGGHSITLSLTAASWVEVVGQDGSRLEYGLLPAGTSKTWRSDQPLDVRIGNADGAQMSIDGQPVALDALRHANVAHFRMQIAAGKATAAVL